MLFSSPVESNRTTVNITISVSAQVYIFVFTQYDVHNTAN